MDDASSAEGPPAPAGRTRVLVIGLDPRRVPGPWDPAPVVAAIDEGLARFTANGIDVLPCLIGLDGSDDVPEVVAAALGAGLWDCVVVGGGLRGSDDQLELFETVLDLVRRHPPSAPIAFNRTPADTYDAAARALARRVHRPRAEGDHTGIPRA